MYETCHRSHRGIEGYHFSPQVPLAQHPLHQQFPKAMQQGNSLRVLLRFPAHQH
jgi:hypothetical protein